MTLETALLSALSAVTAALCWSVQLLYLRLQKAESTVESLRKALDLLNHDHGEASAKVEMFERCPRLIDCPFFKTRT
jgi:hypothetical protein